MIEAHTVYVVMHTKNYEHDIDGVFTTKEGADIRAKELGRNAYVKEMLLI